jgi:hypothetical protein
LSTWLYDFHLWYPQAYGGVAELADAADSKSAGALLREGSIPFTATKLSTPRLRIQVGLTNDKSKISRLLNLPATRVWTAETPEVG